MVFHSDRNFIELEEKFVKKILTIMLAMALLCSCVSGLADISPDNKLPIVTEPTALNVAIGEDPRITDYDDNDFTRYLEEKTGIDIQFTYLPATDQSAKVKLMFASDDLPDLFMSGYIDKFTLYDYGDQGLVLPMNQYIEEYGVNFNKMVEQAANKFTLPLCTAPDGNIYFLPMIIEEYHGIYSDRSWIYKPWLDKLNLEIPKTTDEFVEVLKQFRDSDPNGNGENDEIPLTSHEQGKYLVNFFMNSFIWSDNSNYLIVDEEGNVSPAYFKPEFREGLEWMHMLVEEKLLDPAAFTQDDAVLKALLNADEPVVGCVASPWLDGGWMDTASQRRQDLVFMGPLEGPKGVRYSTPHIPAPSIGMYITYKCANPEVAFRLGDFMLDPYVSMLNRYGVEGRDWEYVDGDEEALNGGKAVWRDINEIWQLTETNAYWRRKGPHFHPLGTFETISAKDPKMAYNKLLVETAGQLEGLHPDKYVPSVLALNADEMSVYVDLRTSIDTYLWENISKFIIGDRSFEEYDAFLAEFDKMNIDDFIGVIDSCYKRMSAE